LFEAGIEPRSPTLQADSLPAEPQGKPQNTEYYVIYIEYLPWRLKKAQYLNP